jgi:deoxyribose-phosphate aldolase
MTPLELDELVREIGNEVQRRLAPALPPAHACACATAVPRRANGAAGHAAGRQGIAAVINQALLQPEAGAEDIRQLCREARQYRFGAVCVQPAHVAVAVRELRGSSVKVATVIAYPYGATLTPVKLAEASQALKLGASELEWTLHPGALNSGDLDSVYTEIRLAAECAHAAGAALKVLTEMAALAEEHRVLACALARLGGADIVKTSLDLPGAAAPAGDVALAHRIVGGELGVEAAGGVDSYRRFCEMLAAGATRVATAAGAAIVNESGLDARGPVTQNH